MPATKHIVFPGSNARMKTLTRSYNGAGYGCGFGAVLLDGGIGGQSSYFGIDHYIETTGRDPRTNKMVGQGLDDKIRSRLTKLNIAPPASKPKMKNITLSI